MVRPQPFVTPQHHSHITLSLYLALYLSLLLWPAKRLGYTFIHSLCTPLLCQPFAQKLFGLACPVAPRPLSSDRNPNLLETMPSQHNLVLVLHLNTSSLPIITRSSDTPLPALV